MKRAVFSAWCAFGLAVSSCLGSSPNPGEDDTTTLGLEDDDLSSWGTATPSGDDDGADTATPAGTTGTPAVFATATPTPGGDDDSVLQPTPLPPSDGDGDGVADVQDNCPAHSNPAQEDRDGDGLGDACDPCPDDATNDEDEDGVCNASDNCPSVPNAGQVDGDADGLGDACDPCPYQVGGDPDGDGTCDTDDNCPGVPNANQMDRDLDGVGDACDPCPDDDPDDPDGDGVCGPVPEPSDPDPSFFFLGSSPDQGFVGVSASSRALVYFSEPYPGSAESVSARVVSGGGDVAWPEVEILDQAFAMDLDLVLDRDYCLVLEIAYQQEVPATWPLRHVACFSTRPVCGLPIEVGYDITITTVGGSAPLAYTLNSLLEAAGNDVPVILLFEHLGEEETFPLSDVVADIGAYERTEDGGLEIRQDGYAASFQGCTIAQLGDLLCHSDLAVLPMITGDVPVSLHFRDVAIEGTVISSGRIYTMSDFVLDAALPEADIITLAAMSGSSSVADLVALDRDLDGDGVLDAATVVIETSPRPITFPAVACVE